MRNSLLEDLMLFRDGPEVPGNEIGMAQRGPQQFDALSVGWQHRPSDARLVPDLRFASVDVDARVPPQSVLQRTID